MVVHDCSLHDLNPEVVADHMHKSGTQAARIILKIAMKILLVGLLGYLIGVHFITKPPEDQLEKFNSATTALMERLVSKKYFRLIRLNLNSECPLKFINKICKSKSCSVCRCDSKDIPSFWSKTDRVLSSNPNEHVDLWQKQRLNDSTWVWHVQDEQNDEGEYFDIHQNIESFTNYNGSYIWKLIYEENCFHGKYEDMCSEERTLFKIISGLHTSISSHLTRFYKHSTNVALWAPLKNSKETNFHFNHTEYKARVLDHPDRVANLFFIYQMLALAVKEISPYLSQNFSVQSDHITEDLQSTRLLKEILEQINRYDLHTAESESLKLLELSNKKVKDIQHYIHNISRLLNCVECEKCRLFGKMQTYGVGTALKILLGYKQPYKRNEIVALFNVFTKISMSVETYYHHREQVLQMTHQKGERDGARLLIIGGGAVLLLLLALLEIGFVEEIRRRWFCVQEQAPKHKGV